MADYQGVSRAKRDTATCLKCKEPIIKGEGRTKIRNYSGTNSKGDWSNLAGYFCYKCSLEKILMNISYWKGEKVKLKKANKINEKLLNEKKIARML